MSNYGTAGPLRAAGPLVRESAGPLDSWTGAKGLAIGTLGPADRGLRTSGLAEKERRTVRRDTVPCAWGLVLRWWRHEVA